MMRLGVLAIFMNVFSSQSLAMCRFLPGESWEYPPENREVIFGEKSLKVKSIKQISSRSRYLERWTEIQKSEVDFESVVPNVQIHVPGSKVADSKFDPSFGGAAELVELVRQLLPDRIKLDQHNRAEITLDLSISTGFDAVGRLDQLPVGSQKRMGQQQPGGKNAREGSIDGAWYPSSDGTIKNARFVPNVILVDAPPPKTNLVTVIIEQNGNEKPRVVALFPGRNAPQLPFRIPQFNIDTTPPGSLQRIFWDAHFFYKPRGV